MIALPLLLFVCAAIVNIGMVAMWRVRGEVVSRDIMWRSRPLRGGEWESPPGTWPQDAAARVAESPPIDDLGNLLVAPVAHGPLPNGFTVHDTLDGRRGAREGVADVDRPYPLLTSLGRYESGEIDSPLLVYRWPCSEMNLANISRRTKTLYELPATDQSLPMAVSNAAEDMFAMPNWSDLQPLDADADILQYYGHYLDFHPRIRHPYASGRIVDPRYCETDREIVYDDQVTRLVDTLDAKGKAQLHEISYLPRRMTSTFLGMYEAELDQHLANIDAWEEQIEALKNPPPPPRTIPPTPVRIDWETIDQLQSSVEAAQVEVDRLTPLVESLKTYQSKLPEIEDELRAKFEAAQPGGME